MIRTRTNECRVESNTVDTPESNTVDTPDNPSQGSVHVHPWNGETQSQDHLEACGIAIQYQLNFPSVYDYIIYNLPSQLPCGLLF